MQPKSSAQVMIVAASVARRSAASAFSPLATSAPAFTSLNVSVPEKVPSARSASLMDRPAAFAGTW